MSKTTKAVSEIQELPLTLLEECPLNPRRIVDDAALNELAASIKVQGLIHPVLVRPAGDKFQVVAGKRRYLAAQKAEVETLRAEVRELTDAQCLEIAIVENLQRRNVHPMEEAQAFHALLHTEGLNYTVETVAAKAGKGPAFVAQRLKLIDLIPAIVEAFLADQIGVGHALEIAKLPQDQQQRAFDAAFRTVWNGGKDVRLLLPLRDFTAWIEQNIFLSLDKVPFDRNDATLVPEAGSCAECPKRTGFNTLLFGELGSQHDSCSDAACYQNKLDQCVARQIAKKPELVQIATAHVASGGVLPRGRYVALQLAKTAKAKQPLSSHQKPCKHMSEAIVVDGAERGHTVKVCAEPTCGVHFADRRAPSPAQIAKDREQRRKEIEKRKLEVTVRHRILANVLKKVEAPLDRADLVLIAGAMLERMEPLRRENLARRRKIVDGASSEITYPQVQKALQRLLRQSDESSLSKLIVEIVLLGSVESEAPGEGDHLSAAAKRHRVDVAAARTAVEAEFAARQTKIAARQKKKATGKTTKTAQAA
jgi:ParB family transcriptional regulator, chromosome partitioning protein